MSVKSKKPRLGRGLSSLMSPAPVSVSPPEMGQGSGAEPTTGTFQAPATGEAVGDIASPLAWLPLDSLLPNPYQPRQRFDEQSLSELAASIRQAGVMQPIVVRRQRGTAGKYEIVAGERRWRAAQIAGLTVIPAVVRDLDDRQLAEWAVIENLQREDLDPIEQAHALARLVEQFGLTHEQVAERVGIDRTTVTNSLRLLHLASDVQEFVRRGQLTAGHVRSLLGIESDPAAQLELATRAVKEAWSVRKLEDVMRQLAAKGLSGGGVAPRAGAKARQSAHLADVARQVSQQLNTRVEIRPGREKNSGKLTIDYYGLDQFDDLMKKLGVSIE
jgi:ParB family transcriptional regulator, chromosome partitioning protein